MSSTRFVAYLYECLSNNEKSLSISINVLEEKSVSSSSKETQEKAGRLLRSWKTQQWMLTNLGIIDIFRLLGKVSKKLQTVELFPWEIHGAQERLISNLRNMANLKLTDEDGEVFDKNFDAVYWDSLGKEVEKVISGEYKGQEASVLQGFRRGRSADDISRSSLSLLITVQNRLSSLCSAIADRLEDRLSREKDHKSTDLVKTTGKCLNIDDILEKGVDDEAFNRIGENNLRILLVTARYSDDGSESVIKEYKIFKRRLCNLHRVGKEGSDLVRMNEHNLYKLHKCSEECDLRSSKTCDKKGKIIEPKQPIAMKFLHLFLKEKDLFDGIKGFLHLLLRCLLKTHAETVAESMGNLIDLHSEKRRGLGVEDAGRETFIDWNGPPVHMVDALGEKTLNRVFKGGKWHFVTVINRADSEVTRRLKSKPAKLPFF